MKQRRLGFVLTALLLAFKAPLSLAADLRNVLVDYSVTSWSQKDGLPWVVIWAIAQDAEGYLWLGTDAGPVRFDGVHFVRWEPVGPVPLPQASVRALCASRDGSVWLGFGEQGGVSRIRGEDLRNYGEADGIDRGAVTMLFEDPGGNIWAGNGNALYKFAGERWEQWDDGLPQGSVNATYVDRFGHFFIATAAGVFSRSPDHEMFQKVAGFDGAVRDISGDSLGRIWVTDPVVGFRTLHERTATRYSPERGRGRRLLHDTRGNLWIGTGGQGLWRMRLESATQGPTVEKVTSLTGFSADGVTSLLEDREGNIWAATLDGLNRLTPRKVTPVMNLGPVNGVEVTPDGSVWVGTVDGLIEFAKGSVESRREPEGLRNAPLSAMHADERGRLWVATDRELVRFVGGRPSAVSFIDSAPPRQISSITSDLEGGVWLYDRDRGLLRWNGGRVEALALPTELGRARVVCTYTDRRGRLWISFANGRLAIVDGGGNVELYGPQDGLDAGEYRAIYEDRDGVVWLGGIGGLSKVAAGKVTTLHAADGFPAESVTAVIEDDARGLWLGVPGSGIVHIDRGELERALASPSHPVRYNLYDRSDGSAGTPQWYGNRGAVRGQDGRLWFVTGRGVTIINPSSLQESSAAPPSVRIESVLADGRRVGATARTLLAPGTARVEIHYTTPSLTAPLKTRFRYRVEGFDADWVDADTQREAAYTNLRPGQYRFHVVASNSDGTWPDAGTVLDFSIQPQFYQRTWFSVACLGVLIVVLAGAWRFRLRQVRWQFSLLLQERARLSREIHDTLLQSLVGVALQCDAMANDFDSPAAPKKEQFVRLRKNVEEYIREARQSIWDLRSPKLQGCDLGAALRDAGEHATAGQHVGFELTVNGTPHRCCAKVEDQLLRIGQEAVFNAVRHARASQIRVELEYSDAAVFLRVSDDGRGFDPEHPATEAEGHYGLVTMKERAESVGGCFKVARHVGGGTEIETIVPTSSHV